MMTKAPNAETAFKVLPPSAPCPRCSALVPFRPVPMSFFEGRLDSCPQCKKPIDDFEMILKALLLGGFDFFALGAVGARVSVFPLELKREEVFHLRLAQYGVPADARVIGINYTPQGPKAALFPLEMHSNRPMRYDEPMERYLYPMPRPNTENKTTTVSTAVTWVPNPKVNVLWDLLVDAFNWFYVGRLEATIIPSNTAVEVAIGQLLRERIESVVSEQRAEEFLKNGATYGHQLNVLLPLLARMKGLPRLSERIQNRLRQLNSFRNTLAHSGKAKGILAKAEVAECLTAALLAIHYADVIRPELLKG